MWVGGVAKNITDKIFFEVSHLPIFGTFEFLDEISIVLLKIFFLKTKYVCKQNRILT